MQPTIFDALYQNAPTIFIIIVIFNILMSFLLGFLISSIYKWTYQGYTYSASFVNTLVLISMVTAIVIMVIGNNLARAFGLVGAMSIIRFRTAVKDTKDIAFVFFALAGGLAAGAGNHMVGLVGCAVVGLVAILLYLFNFVIIEQKELLLRFWMEPVESETPPYMPIFDKYLVSHRLVNMRSARLGQFLELSFNVKFKKDVDHQRLIREMSMIEGIERISLILGETTEDPSY